MHPKENENRKQKTETVAQELPILHGGWVPVPCPCTVHVCHATAFPSALALEYVVVLPADGSQKVDSNDWDPCPVRAPTVPDRRIHEGKELTIAGGLAASYPRQDPSAAHAPPLPLPIGLKLRHSVFHSILCASLPASRADHGYVVLHDMREIRVLFATAAGLADTLRALTPATPLPHLCCRGREAVQPKAYSLGSHVPSPPHETCVASCVSIRAGRTPLTCDEQRCPEEYLYAVYLPCGASFKLTR